MSLGNGCTEPVLCICFRLLTEEALYFEKGRIQTKEGTIGGVFKPGFNRHI